MKYFKYKYCTVLVDDSIIPEGFHEGKKEIKAPDQWKIKHDNLHVKSKDEPREVELDNPFIEDGANIYDQWVDWKAGGYYWEPSNDPDSKFYEFNGKLYLQGGTWRC